MARVTGIGGFFFRARDTEMLAQWYERHLGIKQVPKDYDTPAWRQEAGTTVFAPFPQETTYFGNPAKQWMLNLRVDDLAGMVEALRAEGIEVEVDAEVHPNGRFALLHDPEGNPVQLWEPENEPPTP